MPNYYLACDLGAESGRVMLGTLGEGRLELKEIHRCPNVPLRAGESLHWNISSLAVELKEGLRRARALNVPFKSISTDSWGVDYLLFDREGNRLEPAFHYRDPRTRGAAEKVFQKVPWTEVFAETGIQFMPINTLYQLAVEQESRLQKADFLLGIADAFNYLLSGIRKMDVTMASTFQLYNPVKKNWSEKLIATLNLPRRIFPDLVEPGTVLGPLREELALELGLERIPVVASCSHDTAAAVAGTPGWGDNWGYISSGTWSLLGVELKNLALNDRCRELNFTNEIGYAGSVRLLKNVSGMWLVQECRRSWRANGKEFSYPELAALSASAEPFRTLIDPMAEEFLAPEDMPKQIASYCRRIGEQEPGTVGEFVRASYESLALLYRHALDQLEQVTGRRVERIHIVGGGSNNDTLNQFTANATGRTVYAGPAEATALGNVMVQAITMGDIPSLEAGRQIVKNSCDLRTFVPRDEKIWTEQYERFCRIKQQAA